MRADRLVAILLLLQRRGRVTARDVAEELEISERTARRDLDALAMAGVPVYSLRGRHGGWALAGGGRTDLSGLTDAEVRALFLLAGPSSTASPELRAALRKLVRALPESFRQTAEAAATAVVVDRTGWRGVAPAADPPLLGAVQQAVVEGRQADLSYRAADGTATTRVVHPLGLVVKGSRWYLLAGTARGQRTFRVDRIVAIALRPEPVARPEGFDLATAWRSATTTFEDLRSPATARALVAPDHLSLVRWMFGSRVTIGPGDGEGRVEVLLRSASHRALAGEIAGLGDAVEVVAPDEVRTWLATVAGELGRLYGAAPAAG